MWVKVVIVGLLLAIVGTLMTSMRFLVKDPSDRRRTLTLLKVRVTLSITLVAFVVFSYYMGWIQPHPVIPASAP